MTLTVNEQSRLGLVGVVSLSGSDSIDTTHRTTARRSPSGQKFPAGYDERLLAIIAAAALEIPIAEPHCPHPAPISLQKLSVPMPLLPSISGW